MKKVYEFTISKLRFEDSNVILTVIGTKPKEPELVVSVNFSDLWSSVINARIYHSLLQHGIIGKKVQFAKEADGSYKFLQIVPSLNLL